MALSFLPEQFTIPKKGIAQTSRYPGILYLVTGGTFRNNAAYRLKEKKSENPAGNDDQQRVQFVEIC